MPIPDPIPFQYLPAASATETKTTEKFQTSMNTGYVNTASYVPAASSTGKRLLVVMHKTTGGQIRIAAFKVVTSFVINQSIDLQVPTDKLQVGLNHEFHWVSTPLDEPAGTAGTDPGGNGTVTFSETVLLAGEVLEETPSDRGGAG